MNIEKLKSEIPYKWRIGNTNKAKTSATCVAYIDARDVMDLLDFIVGAENWKDEYQIIGEQTMCGLSIRSENGEWVTKWDTGTAGNIETEKSTISDAFKRAAVKWGVGRFLYDMEMPWVDVMAYGNTVKPVYPHNKEIIWDLSEYINSQEKHAKRIEKARNVLKEIKRGENETK